MKRRWVQDDESAISVARRNTLAPARLWWTGGQARQHHFFHLSYFADNSETWWRNFDMVNLHVCCSRVQQLWNLNSACRRYALGWFYLVTVVFGISATNVQNIPDLYRDLVSALKRWLVPIVYLSQNEMNVQLHGYRVALMIKYCVDCGCMCLCTFVLCLRMLAAVSAPCGFFYLRICNHYCVGMIKSCLSYERE